LWSTKTLFLIVKSISLLLNKAQANIPQFLNALICRPAKQLIPLVIPVPFIHPPLVPDLRLP